MLMSIKKSKEMLDKLMQIYHEKALIYGDHYFSTYKLRERYIKALQDNLDLKKFFQSEYVYLDQVVKNIEKKKLQKEARVNRQSETLENEAKIIIDAIKNYPSAEIHPKAHLEIKKIIGALQSILPQLQGCSFYVDQDLHGAYLGSVSIIKNIVTPPYFPMLREYLEDISVARWSSAEMSMQGILRHIAKSLNDLFHILEKNKKQDSYLDSIRDIIKRTMIDFRLEIFLTPFQ